MWKKVTFAALFIVFLSSTLPIHEAMGQATTLSVQPTNSFGINLGDTFSINITVSNVIDLDGWQFNLYYESAVLNATSYSEGPFLQTGGATTFFSVVNFTDHYDDTFGVVGLNCLRFSIPTGVDGSGTLAAITFKAVGSGPSVLHFGDAFLPMKLFNSTNHLIPFTPIDGAAYVGAVDVAIGEIDTPSNIPQGSMTLINVTAQNRGQPTETFDVTLSADGSVIGTQTVVNLPGGGSQILIFAWDTTPLQVGQYTLTATATAIVGEIDYNDNTLSVNVYVGTIDIAITGVNTKTSIPAGFNGTEVDVTIENSGQATETFNVTLSVNSQSVDSQTTTLNPGTSGTVALWWNTTTLGYGTYTMQVFIPPLPFQIDTSNNNFTTTAVVTIPGDLNGDFKVSLADLVILAQAYGSRPSNLNWNANADIDGNGVVGLTDLVNLATHYGEQFP
jgi:general secretion pathway protein D